MIYKPFQSCLIPYEDEIIALRRKRPPVSFARIAAILREKYQITIRRENIFRFVQIRAKGFKSCKYAWNINPDNQPSEEAPQKHTALQTTKPKVSSFDPSKVELTEYSPTWDLHRPNTDEEREAYRQFLREEKLKHKQ